MVRQRYKKMAKLCYYICSPLSAPTQAGIMKNKEQAGRYVEIVSRITDKRAIAPHAILPGHFDDNIPEEREICLQFGLEVLSLCDAMVVCGNRVSSGMKGEITLARCKGKKIYALRPDFDGKAVQHGYKLVNFDDVKEEFSYV